MTSTFVTQLTKIQKISYMQNLNWYNVKCMIKSKSISTFVLLFYQKTAVVLRMNEWKKAGNIAMQICETILCIIFHPLQRYDYLNTHLNYRGSPTVFNGNKINITEGGFWSSTFLFLNRTLF